MSKEWKVDIDGAERTERGRRFQTVGAAKKMIYEENDLRSRSLVWPIEFLL